jgi:hypothetical protein
MALSPTTVPPRVAPLPVGDLTQQPSGRVASAGEKTCQDIIGIQNKKRIISKERTTRLTDIKYYARLLGEWRCGKFGLAPRNNGTVLGAVCA